MYLCCVPWSLHLALPRLRVCETTVHSLDDAKTNDLPTLDCLAIGAPVALHKKPQFVLLEVCNNSDGIVRSIEIDEREKYLTQQHVGYTAVRLKYPLIRIFVYIKTADDAGLKLLNLPRGVISVVLVQRNFTVNVNSTKRKFAFKRTSTAYTGLPFVRLQEPGTNLKVSTFEGMLGDFNAHRFVLNE